MLWQVFSVQMANSRRFMHLHRRVVLRSLFIGHTDVLQHLRIDLQWLSQLAHGHLLRQHDFHHLQAGQDTITSAGVLAEDNMTTLLTADTAAVLSHVLIDVLVTHCGLGVADALLIKSLIQAKVGHDRGNDGTMRAGSLLPLRSRRAL